MILPNHLHITNWLTNTLLGKVFPLLPLPLAFGFFAVCCLAGCCLCYFAQPETTALSLEQIGTAFATHRPKLRRRFWTEARRNMDNGLIAGAVVQPVDPASVVVAAKVVEMSCVS